MKRGGLTLAGNLTTNFTSYSNLLREKILVTCRDEWGSEDIIAAYHGQSNVERVFKHFKNPYHNTVRPQYHWIDQKIKVHTFIVTGLLLSQLVWKKAKKLGYTSSMETIIDELSKVRQAEIITVTGLKGKASKRNTAGRNGAGTGKNVY